jgi:hypothetical protein
MSESKITFQDLGKIKEYEFHFEADYGEKGLVSDDATVIIPGSGGRPANGFFWGVNKRTGKSTDSIYFSNYYAPDYVVILRGIEGDSLKYSMVSLSNSNTTGDEDKGGTSDIKNKQLLEDAREHAYSKNTKYLLMIGLPIIALILMIIYFMKRRKRRRLNENI